MTADMVRSAVCQPQKHIYSECKHIHHSLMTYLKDLHDRTKWASSIATSPIFFCTARFLNTGFGSPTLSKKDSGVVRMMSNWAWAILFMTELSFCMVPRKVALSSVPSSALIWSRIRLMVGIKTMVTFLVTTQGNWKHRLLPEPVGCTTRVFLPPRVALMIRSCQSLKDVFLKTFTSNPISCASWCPAVANWVAQQHCMCVHNDTVYTCKYRYSYM